MSKKYHLVVTGLGNPNSAREKECVSAIKLLQSVDVPFALTFIDRCPEFVNFFKNYANEEFVLSSLTGIDVPMIFEYIGSDFEKMKFVGGYSELLTSISSE